MPGAEVNTAPVLPTNSKHNPFSEGFDFAKKVPFPRAQGRRSSLANRANILQFRPRTVRQGSMEINHITKSVAGCYINHETDGNHSEDNQGSKGRGDADGYPRKYSTESYHNEREEQGSDDDDDGNNCSDDEEVTDSPKKQI